MKLSLVVDYIAGSAGYRPIIVSKVRDCRARVGDQIDVVRGRVRLIEGVGKVCLQIKAGERVPSDCLTDHMLLDFAALLLIQRLTFWDEPLAIDRSVYKIVSRNQSKR